MTKTVKLVQIGNSKGVRIPQELIQRYQLVGEVQLTETENGLLLQCGNSTKLSFEDSFAEMAREGCVQDELEAWAPAVADGLPDDDFSGWPR